MNEKEIGEIRRHIRRDHSNITTIYGCYVNDNKEIIASFRQSTGMMSENEGEKYFGLLRRVLSGGVGKNLIDLTFRTAQVADSPEHRLLMNLRDGGLEQEKVRDTFFHKIIDTVVLEGSYLILIGCDSYDVPFKGKDGSIGRDNSDEAYRFLLCAVCPVKQTKASLHYVPEEKTFRDGAMIQPVSAPELGFLFPAFDNRSTNIYSALYYTHSTKAGQDAMIETLFNVPVPKPAAEQKECFEGLLSDALGEDCSMDVVQTVHNKLCQRIELHKESKVPEPLLIGREDMKEILQTCGVTEEHVAKFSVDYDSTFGFDAPLHPKNIIDSKHFQVQTPDAVIRMDPAHADLIETRVIGGIRYLLIPADASVEVNGVNIYIGQGTDNNAE